MNTTFRSLICAGSLLMAGQVTVPASAESATTDPSTPIVRSTQIDISRLDLSRPEDVRMLRHRIERAAREVCGVPTGFTMASDPISYREYHLCVEHAVQGALAQVDALQAARANPVRARMAQK